MNETVLITGASSGIGRACALELGKTYQKIALMGYRHGEQLSETAATLRELGAECLTACGDLADYDFVKGFTEQILGKWGHIDILINNAGISYVGLLTDMTPADWKQVMDTNVTSVFNTCHCVIPSMVHEKSGRILNISSIWGNVGASCEVAYSASKGAINAFTRALGKELAPSGISVNAIAFGVIDTPMNDCVTPEEKAALCEEIPAGRMASSGEAAAFMAKIVTSPAYLTAQVLTFDGGFL